MDKDNSMKVIVKGTKVGRARRVLLALSALFVLAALIGIVAAAFRGRHVPKDAAALTKPGSPSAKHPWRPWWLQRSD